MGPLTQPQQELVERHLGLVYLHVKRQLRRLPPRARTREREDLVQEGMMALTKAASRYEPERCGPFAAYALTHIHGQLCRYLLRQMDGLAMPESAAHHAVRQRRGDAGLVDPGKAEWPDERTPAEPPLPRFLDLHESLAEVADATYSRDRQSEREDMAHLAGPHGHARSAAWLHARYEQALRWAVQQILATRGIRVDHSSLVHAVVQERLLVPAAEFRTSGRQIARRFACSTARVWNVERRLLDLARRNLADQAGVTHEAASIVCNPSQVSAVVPSSERAPAVVRSHSHQHTRSC